MGSSFEDLVATSPTMKTDTKPDKRFELKKHFKFSKFALNDDNVSNSVFYACMQKKAIGAHRCE